MNLYDQIAGSAKKLTPELIRQRRDFHKYAEKGWFEMRTTSIVARRLMNLGYEVLLGEEVCKRESRMGVPADEVLEREYRRAVEQGADQELVSYTRGGMTGVIGILRCGEGPVVALRFDLDALGLEEDRDESHLPAREGFCSVNPGQMHACGHDAHTTIGLGVAKILTEIRSSLKGTVKLIFQPAEEGVRGAKSIVDNGHLDDVDFLIGNHVIERKDDDPAVIIPGTVGSLASSKYDIYFHGKAAHAGSAPERGNNVMLALAAAITNLYAIPRHSGGVSRINVGTVAAGSGRNVIADEAKLEIEVRGDNTEINRFMEDYALRVAQAAADMHGCTCECRLMGSAQSMVSDLSLMQRVKRVCEEKLNFPVSAELSNKNRGSEDFSYMMTRVQEHGGQATFMRCPTREPAPAHTRSFDIDEADMTTSVILLSSLVCDILTES